MTKIIVAGAGLAGLCAAVRLTDAGYEVEVLEGRDQIGGRSRSRAVDGTVIELGGQFVSRSHRRMRELVADAGLHLQRTRLWSGPTHLRHSISGSRLSISALRDLVALTQIVFGANSLGAVRAAADVSAQDAMSVNKWLDGIGLRGPLRPVVDTLIGQTFGGAAPGEISLLAFAELIGGEGNGMWFLLDGFGLTDYIVEGVGALCAHLADRLPAIRLGTPIVSVEQDSDAVSVRTAEGDVVAGDHLVLTVPEPILDTIDISPPLPESLRAVSDGLRFGQAVKVAAVVRRRGIFRTTGFVGGTMVHQGWRAGDVLYGLADPDKSASDLPMLIADLCAGFKTKPQHVVHAELINWAHDPFTYGTYGHFLPGKYQRFRKSLPHCDGRIHVAGSERSTRPGFMEGAVESGEAAADAILAATSPLACSKRTAQVRNQPE